MTKRNSSTFSKTNIKRKLRKRSKTLILFTPKNKKKKSKISSMIRKTINFTKTNTTKAFTITRRKLQLPSNLFSHSSMKAISSTISKLIQVFSTIKSSNQISFIRVKRINKNRTLKDSTKIIKKNINLTSTHSRNTSQTTTKMISLKNNQF